MCPQHGDFFQTPNTHLGGHGCDKCGGRIVTDTATFIEASVRIHGTKYDYNKVLYVRSQDKVIIACPTHGPFRQRPNNHLNGSGCEKCARGVWIETTEAFVTEAKRVHGERTYGYEKSAYERMTKPLIIICRDHGEFLQSPSNHITHGEGCMPCGRERAAAARRRDIEDFLTCAKAVHGDEYDYTKMIMMPYIHGHSTAVLVTCRKHGDYSMTAQAHLQGHGCRLCHLARLRHRQTHTREEFIEAARAIHGSKLGYDKVTYTNNSTHVTIVCPSHGEFQQIPQSHLNSQYGCPACGRSSRSVADLLQASRWKHGADRFIIELEEDTSLVLRQVLTIKCCKHGQFINNSVRKHLHLNSGGCPGCEVYGSGWSKAGMAYVELMAKIHNVTMMHALNGGEFRVPGTRWKADGYAQKTNTIYEFHGTIWHGDPRVCDPAGVNYRTGVQNGVLYYRTLERTQALRDAGFTVIEMWEYDWDRLKKAVKVLQRCFRCRRHGTFVRLVRPKRQQMCQR